MLDPFMGSGTTLVAAAAAGRAGIEIEIEIEKKYCELAQERIASTTAILCPFCKSHGICGDEAELE